MTPAPKNLFVVREKMKPLCDSDRESFHSVVAKALWAAKRARPDIMPSIPFSQKE